MNEEEITTEHCGRTYNHGTIKVVQKEGYLEWSVEIEAHLVIGSQDYSQLHKDIQEVIRKYAI